MIGIRHGVVLVRIYRVLIEPLRAGQSKPRRRYSAVTRPESVRKKRNFPATCAFLGACDPLVDPRVDPGLQALQQQSVVRTPIR